jgi:hypothetical protein
MFTARIQVDESFHVRALDLANFIWKKGFQLLNSFCGLEDEGDRAGWTEHGLGISHVES